MTYPAEGLCHCGDLLGACIAPHGGDGRHIIFYVVPAGQKNVAYLQEGEFFLAPGTEYDHAVLFVNGAVARPKLFIRNAVVREQCNGTSRRAGETSCDFIFIIQNRTAASVENLRLGGNILFHIGVPVQMVGGDIGDHGRVRGAVCRHQLKAGQFHHGHVAFTHLLNPVQHGLADVAAQEHVVPHRLKGFTQNFGDQGGGGGFAVASRDADDGAGAILKEQFHLRGDRGTRFFCFQQSGEVRSEAGGAEHVILTDVFKIGLAADQGYPQFPQLFRILTQIRLGFFIPGAHSRSFGNKITRQGHIGNACSQKGYGFILKIRQCHTLPHNTVLYNHYIQKQGKMQRRMGFFFDKTAFCRLEWDFDGMIK